MDFEESAPESLDISTQLSNWVTNRGFPTICKLGRVRRNGKIDEKLHMEKWGTFY